MLSVNSDQFQKNTLFFLFFPPFLPLVVSGHVDRLTHLNTKRVRMEINLGMLGVHKMEGAGGGGADVSAL